MILRRLLTICAAVIVTTAFVQGQPQNSEHAQNTQPTFKAHRLGESAQEFFSIAKMEGNEGMLSTEYCRQYFNDPRVKKAIEKAKRRSGEGQPLPAALMNLEGCNRIQAALAGGNVDIELRFAAEFDSGSARFVAGRLASLDFIVNPLFNDVVEDMTAKLEAKPQIGVETIQNSVGAIVKRRNASWTLPNTVVRVTELHSLEGGDIGTTVSVSDPEILKHRANSLN